MFRNSHSRFFPTPEYLEMPSFGLDISDESVKFAQFLTSKKGVKLGHWGERKIPSGIIESGKIKDIKRLEEIFTTLKKEEKINSVRVSLPEEQVYMFKIALVKEGLKDIREGIELSLEEHIPMKAEEAIFDYEIIREDDKELELQVAAIPRNIIDSYLSIFQNSNIRVQSFELEAQAIARAVVLKGDQETYMIVDFGEKRTGIFVVSHGVVMFASTLDFGGRILTNMIQKNFNISFEDAEKMKQEYGLQRNLDNKETFAILLNGVSILRDEIAKHFLYWQTHKDEEGKNNPPIRKIILCGGDSNLLGLTDYFSVSMKSKVEIANVWTNVSQGVEDIPEIGFMQSLSFATAIGLALGDFYND